MLTLIDLTCIAATLCVMAAPMVLIIICCCVVAGRADRAMERMFDEH